jgi:catechol 2,3-dioxygenase-like lactoylglutathione lyase family enzyme
MSAKEKHPMAVSELRLVVTTEDYDAAVAFYRDTLGLSESAEYLSEDQGRVIILDAGRATLEIADPGHAVYVDDVEVGRRVAGHVRVAFGVPDAAAATDMLTEAGATLIAAPTRTPWNSLNSRLDAPAGLQLTLFQDVDG